MSKIRVLVVDDSVVMRRLICNAIESSEGFEVAGTAADGCLAIAKLKQCAPDVVTLDVEMPNMDGVETLREIKKMIPALPVIMFSTLTERGATTTLDALSLGASDYVTKPSGAGSAAVAVERIREQLIPKIQAICTRRVPTAVFKQETHLKAAVLERASTRESAPATVLAIGTSTGGPTALAEVLSQLPADFPIPVLVVQHMPPMFTRLLAQRLSKTCSLAVCEAEPGKIVRPGTVWIAPGDFHLGVRADGSLVRLVTDNAPQENFCRPAVDVLFRSVARVYGPGVLAVVMTGMGQDGLRGAEQIYDAGGQILVQDEASSVVWGMPGYVARRGIAEKILPLPEIAGEIMKRVECGTFIPSTPHYVQQEAL